MGRRHVLVAAGAAAVLAAGCNTYKEADFTTTCGASMTFRGIDASATHEIVVHVPDAWVLAMEQATAPVTHQVTLPSADVAVEFDIGHDFDEINLLKCLDFGEPPSPVIDHTLPATDGAVEITLYPAVHVGSVRGDLHLGTTHLSDGETTVTVEGLTLMDQPIGSYG